MHDLLSDLVAWVGAHVPRGELGWRV